MKRKKEEKIVMSKGTMELFKTQAKAMRIYKKTSEAKKEVLGGVFAKKISEELRKKFSRILDEEKPSIQEIAALRNLFGLDKKTFLNRLNLDNLHLDQEIREMIYQYSDIDESIKRTIDERLKSTALHTKTSRNRVIVYLSKDKDLYIEPKERHCYSMRSDYPFNILTFLDSEYKSTESICRAAGAKNNEALRGAIGKLNAQIKSHLGLTANFIQSKPGFGYKINERYEFIKE